MIQTLKDNKSIKAVLWNPLGKEYMYTWNNMYNKNVARGKALTAKADLTYIIAKYSHMITIPNNHISRSAGTPSEYNHIDNITFWVNKQNDR